MRPLIILRPEPGAGASAERAAAMGLEVRRLPLFEVRPLPWTAPDPSRFDGLLLTSANAVRHAGDGLARLSALPVHAVGEATAEAARQAGLRVVAVGSGGIERMRLPTGARLLHLAGRDHRDSEAAETIAVYEAAAVEYPAGLPGLDGSVAAVHSPRAGRRLAELAEVRSGTAIAAISPAAAQACGGGWERVESAERPADASLLALAARLCEESGG